MSDFLDLGLADLEDDSEEAVQAEESDDEFSEAERRLSLARYYQQLTKGGLIDEDSDEARQVDAEVRLFARERMNILIGIAAEKPPAAELPFTEAQVGALCRLADRMIEREEQPAIRPMAPPAPVKPQQPVGPRIKPVAAPPKRKPLATKPAAKTPLPAAKKKGEKAPKKEEAPAIDYSLIPDGEVFEENGKKYKFIQTTRVDDDGNPKRVKLDVTEQARPPNAIPMPRREHMNFVTAQHAADTVDGSIGNSLIGQAAAATAINE